MIISHAFHEVLTSIGKSINEFSISDIRAPEKQKISTCTYKADNRQFKRANARVARRVRKSGRGR